MKSRTDMEDAKRVQPNRERQEPMRTKLRRDIADPRFKKSRMDMVDPIRDMPKTDIEDPRRRKLLRDMAEPK
jgi:hypothetical protein